MTFVQIIQYWMVQRNDTLAQWLNKKMNIAIWVRSKFVGTSQCIIKKLKFLVCPKMNKIKADGLSYKRCSKQTGCSRWPFSHMKSNDK